jgi:hypothetical protein
MRPVTVSGLVPAPADAVFAYVADTRNDPEWCPNVGPVTQVSGSGVEVGARFEFDQAVETPRGTLKSPVTVQVVGVGDRRISWKVEDRFQEREVEVRVAEDGNHSKLTQTTVATFRRPPGVARWVYPFLARKTFRDQFSNLAARFATGDG